MIKEEDSSASEESDMQVATFTIGSTPSLNYTSLAHISLQNSTILNTATSGTNTPPMVSTPSNPILTASSSSTSATMNSIDRLVNIS